MRIVLKPIVTFSRAFSRHWRRLHVFASASNWFAALFTSADLYQAAPYQVVNLYLAVSCQSPKKLILFIKRSLKFSRSPVRKRLTCFYRINPEAAVDFWQWKQIYRSLAMA